jgi:hypothetical protein
VDPKIIRTGDGSVWPIDTPRALEMEGEDASRTIIVFDDVAKMKATHAGGPACDRQSFAEEGSQCVEEFVSRHSFEVSGVFEA